MKSTQQITPTLVTLTTKTLAPMSTMVRVQVNASRAALALSGRQRGRVNTIAACRVEAQIQSLVGPTYTLLSALAAAPISVALTALNTVCTLFAGSKSHDANASLVVTLSYVCVGPHVPQTVTRVIDFDSLHSQLACTIQRIDTFPNMNAISVRRL